MDRTLASAEAAEEASEEPSEEAWAAESNQAEGNLDAMVGRQMQTLAAAVGTWKGLQLQALVGHLPHLQLQALELL